MPEARIAVDQCYVRGAKSYYAMVAKAFTASTVAKVVAHLVKMQTLSQDEEVDVPLGVATLLINVAAIYAKPIVECDTNALFGGALTLLQSA